MTVHTTVLTIMDPLIPYNKMLINLFYIALFSVPHLAGEWTRADLYFLFFG